MEKMLKQIEMGFDPQKSFTKMNKNRDMKDVIWCQVMYLNPPMMKKISEEIRSGNPINLRTMKGLKVTNSLVDSYGRS